MSKNNLVKMAMLSVQRYPWEQGVCMQALYELGDISTAVAMAHDAVLRQQSDGRLAVTGINIAVTDPAANGEVVFHAYEITKDEFYKKAAHKMLSYLLEKAPKTDKGILCHNEISFQKEFSPDQIWVDSIYMAPPFLAVMNHFDEAENQNKTEEKNLLVKTGTELLNNLLRFKCPDGRFHDILDDENSFVEGTGAMMATAFIYRGIYNNWLSDDYKKYADLVSETMDQYVDGYGIIHQVCGCSDFIEPGTSAESMAAYLMMHSWKEKLEKRKI